MARSKKTPKGKPQTVQPVSKKQETFSKFPRGRYVVGIHSAKEVARIRPHAVHSLWLKKGWEENKELTWFAEWAKKNNIKTHVQPVKFFSNLCQTHQGLCLVVTERPKFDYKELDENTKQTVVILDGLEDPHNLGAILRTSWLLGVKAVFVPKKQGSPLTPTAIKVASGAVEHVPVIEEANLASVIEGLKKQGFWVYGLAQNHTTNLYNVELAEKVCWVVGSEAKGIRKPVLNACDETVCIPQENELASFNASVACAMALSETKRQFFSS